MSNLIPFYRATLKNGVLFWDYQNNKAGIHFNEFYRLFDDFFSDTEKYPKGVSSEELFKFFEKSLKKLPTKEEFFKFEFSFDDPEVLKKTVFHSFTTLKMKIFLSIQFLGRL